MKRFLATVLALSSLILFASCGKDYQRADELATNFISALLLRDETAMLEYIHPDHVEEAMPNDEFYETLETQFLTVGHELTNLSGVGKAKIEGMSNTMRCTYIARVNELFYTVELIILDDKNGYGVVSTVMMLNTELDYYYHESE